MDRDRRIFRLRALFLLLYLHHRVQVEAEFTRRSQRTLQYQCGRFDERRILHLILVWGIQVKFGHGILPDDWYLLGNVWKYNNLIIVKMRVEYLTANFQRQALRHPPFS